MWKIHAGLTPALPLRYPSVTLQDISRLLKLFVELRDTIYRLVLLPFDISGNSSEDGEGWRTDGHAAHRFSELPTRREALSRNATTRIGTDIPPVPQRNIADLLEHLRFLSTRRNRAPVCEGVALRNWQRERCTDAEHPSSRLGRHRLVDPIHRGRQAAAYRCEPAQS